MNDEIIGIVALGCFLGHLFYDLAKFILSQLKSNLLTRLPPPPKSLKKRSKT